LTAAPAPPKEPPEPSVAPPSTLEELRAELERMRHELLRQEQVNEQVRTLQAEVSRLKSEVVALKEAQADEPSKAPSARATGVPERYHSGAFAPETHEARDDEGIPIVSARYRYNYDGKGPMGGGGYFSIGTADDKFTVKLTNLFTIDATFFNKNGLETNQQGFTIPFARTYLYGNITKYLSYQVDTQASLGTFNILDLFIAWHITQKLTLRAGKALTPPVYEYYGFKPPLEPVITTSPVAQLAAKRPIGLVMSGVLWDNRVQWWSGVTNSGASLFGNLDNNVDYNGAFTITPFRGRWKGRRVEGLGTGLGFSVGKQRYRLAQTGIAFTNNAEATTNPNFVTVVGLPFYNYKEDVRADGLRYRVAPHIFYFGRFSLLAEYLFHRRELTDGVNGGKSTQHAYYINGSFWLTGERDYKGTGFQGYASMVPRRPLSVRRGQRGWGAWQVAAQWSQFFAGTLDIRRGLVDRETSTSKMDNVMVGLNLWPNKYLRLSVDYVRTWFNHPVPLAREGTQSMIQLAWARVAMFF
jgi:phosphate-selective porin OprO/OprP